MIIEPTPTNPRSPLRRALRVAGLVLPVLLLGVVVGAGMLGPRPEPPPTASPVAELPAATPPSAQPTPGEPATPAPLAAINADDPVPPGTFEDLPVADIAEVLRTRAGSPQGTALAVSGFLRVDGSADDECVDEPPGSLGPWCERIGVLTAWPALSTSSPAGRSSSHLHLPPHLDLSIPAGVKLPQTAAVARQGTKGDVPQVLVVGRFEPASTGCPRAPWGCGETFVVERFAWADGVRVGLTPLIAEPLQTGTKRGSPFGTVLGDSELPLAAVLTWPDGIARLDPDAAALLAARPPSEPVWYVRVLEGGASPGGDRLVRWTLLADRDFGVIGSGREPATTADGIRPGPG